MATGPGWSSIRRSHASSTRPVSDGRRDRQHPRRSLPVVVVLGLGLGSGLGLDPAEAGQARPGRHFVSADVSVGGDGTHGRPFASLSEAEAASGPGDTIYLLDSARVLDGSLALKPGQKLIGLGPDGEPAHATDDRVRLTNTAALPDGVVVQLAADTEIAGVHFVDIGNHAILGRGDDYSNAYIHHATFTGHADEHVEDERGLVYAISLETATGRRDGIRVEHSRFADGEDLGAVRVFHAGDSHGAYRFQGNEFSDLGGRAYFVRTREQSRVETVILDSVADNIGRGERNSDSIIPYLMGQSEQVMLIRNYHFRNRNQEGNQSNTAIEAYLFGQPRDDEANWCTGCTLTLTILDSVIEDSVTDPIQFSNAGTDSVLSYTIRNTRVLGGDPRQGGGGISLNLQPPGNRGGSTTLLVESTDVVGTTGYAVTVNDRGRGAGHALTVDLGGGALGSTGRNRFIDNARGAIRVAGRPLTAAHNWWGEEAPTVHGPDDGTLQEHEVTLEPRLPHDPREASTTDATQR